MSKLDVILDWFEKGIILVCFGVCLVTLNLGVITRYVFMRPLSWPDELTTYLFILMSFVGAAASVRSNSELRVDALYERFPNHRLLLDLWMHAVRLTAAVIFIVTGCQFVRVEMEFMNISPILHIPVPLIFSMLPLLGVLLILRTIIKIFELFKPEGER